MKKFRQQIFAALALALALGVFGAAEANAQINDILKRMDEHYKLLKSLQASVARELYNPQIDESDKYAGTVKLVPGQGRNFLLRLDWTKPAPEMISVVNGQFVAFNPQIKRAYTGQSDSAKVQEKGGGALKIISATSKQEIKSNYDVEYLGQEKITGGIETWHLKLTPKAKSSYKFAELWVDGNGMPLRAKITNNNDTTETVLLSGIRKNDKLKADIFKIKVPKGTEVIPY